MFWRFNFTSSNIVTLLEKEDVTLEEILNEEDVLLECKARNEKLIGFLTRPSHVRKMVQLMINEPPSDGDEKLRYKLANISTEILMSDVAEITDSLLSQPSIPPCLPPTTPPPRPSDPKTPPTAPISPTSPFFQAPTTPDATTLTQAPPTTPTQSPSPTPTNPFKTTTEPPPTTTEPPHLDLIFSFFNQPDLNPLQASFVSKVVGFLITRKSSLILAYLKSRSNSLDQLLCHISTSAIMDVVLKLVVNMDVHRSRAECLKWLKDEDLINRLVDLFKSELSPETHTNTSRLLCDIIKHCREQIAFEQEPLNNNYNNNTNYEGDDDNNNTKNYENILNVIQSESTVSRLLEHTFTAPLQESLVLGGLQVVHTLLELKKIGDNPDDGCLSSLGFQSSLLVSPHFARNPLPDVDKFMEDARGTLKSLVPRLALLHQILLEPPQQHYSPMITTCGPLDRPLGPSRYHVTRLLVCLITLNHAPANLKLLELGTLGVLLDLFHKYCWNNFLHMQFCHLLDAILSNSTTPHPLNTTPNPTNTNTNITITSPSSQHDNDDDDGDGDDTKMDVSADQPSTILSDPLTHNTTISDPLTTPTTITTEHPPLLPTRSDSSPTIHLDSSTKLLSQLLLDFHLLERVMDALVQTPDTKSRAHGYKGHMIKLANQLSSHEHQALVDSILNKQEFPVSVKDRWKDFLSSTLSRLNYLNAPAEVSSPHPSRNDDLINLPFQQDSNNTQKTGRVMRLYAFIEGSMTEQDDFGLSGMTSSSLQTKKSLFEDLCEERHGGLDDDGDDDDGDGGGDDDAKVGKGDEEEEDDEVWEDKLANFPESLLKPDLLERLKEVENEQKLETIRIKDADVVMCESKEEGEERGEESSHFDAVKNVEDMDTTNEWTPFEEPTADGMQTNNNVEEADWADFSQLEKDDKVATVTSDQSVAKTIESAPVTPPLASQ